ncbi:recombinase family protein [Streptomyces sp. NPDC048604]|uniref:recombinase family protein n=1 Tax=Streptomyces sp. NPDC048604 TaxID=3365578 RepID=UPI0037165BB1
MKPSTDESERQVNHAERHGAGGTPEGWLGGRTPLISYARVSADRLNGDSIGVARQHRNNIRSAERQGCAVVLHYEDSNVTAAKAGVARPAFRRMCQDIMHGRERASGIPVRGVSASSVRGSTAFPATSSRFRML